jgi:hypothetical protein
MIRIYCFINARGRDGCTDVLVEALCEDGDFLAAHRSPDERWAKFDIGINSDRQHATYEAHCLGGYTLEWVDRPESHDGIKAAYQRHRQLPPGRAASRAASRRPGPATRPARPGPLGLSRPS